MIAEQIEYAGFWYEITKDDSGNYVATPLPGQHYAANRDKHKRAVLEEYLDGLRHKKKGSN